MSHSYEKYLGVPYKFNGNDLNGLDCINLCVNLARDNNVPMMNINHSHTNQHTYHYLFNLRDSKHFDKVEAQPNVLVVFKVAGRVGHVGYMIDDKHFVHIMEKSCVTLERIDNIMWEKRIVGFYKYVGIENEEL